MPETDESPRPGGTQYIFHEHVRPRSPVRSILRYLSVALMLMIIALLILSWAVGVPEPIEREILRGVNSGPFYVRTSRVHFHPVRGFYALNVVAFRKGVVGDAVLEAERVEFDLAPMALLEAPEHFLHGVTIVGGVIRKDPGDRTNARAGTGRAQLEVTLRECVFEGIWIEEGSARYVLAGPVVRIENLQGIAGRDDDAGSVRGELLFDREQQLSTVKIEAQANPHITIPFLEGRRAGGVAKVIRQLTFNDVMPRTTVDLAIQGRGSNSTVSTVVRYSMQDGTYRKVPVTLLDLTVNAVISATNRTVVLSPLRAVAAQKGLIGDVTLDFLQRRTDFRVVSSIHPHQVGTIASDQLAETLRRYRFGDDTDATVSGSVYALDPKRNVIDVTASGEGLGYGPFDTDRYTLAMQIQGPTTTVSRLDADMWGGRVRADAVIGGEPDRTNRSFAVNFEADSLDFGMVAKHLLNSEDPRYNGDVSTAGSLAGDLRTNWLNTATGQMRIDIDKGALFRVPLFGGLTDLLTKKIPGVKGLVSQTGAGADVTISEGAARSKNIRIEGSSLMIEAQGTYAFENELNYVMKLTVQKKTLVQKIIRIPLDLLSEVFFEIRLTGTTDKPNWFLRRFSRELFQRFGMDVDPKGSDDTERDDTPEGD